MTFALPAVLLLLIAVPFLVAFKVVADLRSRRMVDRLIASRLRPRLLVPGSLAGGWSTFMLECLGIALLVLALARPQWGVTREETQAEGRDILLAIDTSKSMLATDLPPATRLERARLAAQDLIRSLPDDRFGLIAFAGRAFMQAPLTIDHEAIDESLSQLDADIIPRGGTNLAEAVATAVEGFRNSEGARKALILFSDGDALEGTAAEAARQAAEAGIMMITVGIGTRNGAIVPDPQQPGRYISNESGEVVRMQLQPEPLQDLARLTSGAYIEMAPGRDVRRLITDALTNLSETTFAAREIVRPIERFQWFLGGAILSWIVALTLPALFGQVTPAAAGLRSAGGPGRDTEGGDRGGPRPLTTRPLSTATLILAALTASLALAPPRLATAAQDPAYEAFQAGEYAEAVQAYQERLEPTPPSGFAESARAYARDIVRRLSPAERDRPRIAFGLGAAAYRAGDYERAAEAFGGALLSPTTPLQEDAHYNLGNTLYRKGELALEGESPQPEIAVPLWEEAIGHYDAALTLNPNNADAAHNRDLVRRRLEQLKQELQQQQQQQQQDQGEGEGEGESQEGGQPPEDGEQEGEGGRQPRPGDQPGSDQQEGQEGQDGEGEEQDGKGQDNPEQQEGGGEGDTPQDLEGKLEAQDAPEDGENGQSPDREESSAEGRAGDEGVDPETGFSRSQARLLLKNLADEDLGARPRMRIRNENFKDW